MNYERPNKRNRHTFDLTNSLEDRLRQHLEEWPVDQRPPASLIIRNALDKYLPKSKKEK